MTPVEPGAPTPELADIFAAEEQQYDGPPGAPDPAARSGEAAPPATDAAPQAPEQQQPGESAIDYRARVVELEAQIQNRDWSSQGRFLAEQKRSEALEARIKELESGYADEDQRIRAQYDTLIAQNDNQDVRDFLVEKRDLEIEKREIKRDRDRTAAERKVAEEMAQAGKLTEVERHTRTLRTEMLPTLLGEVDEVVRQFDLPEDEAANLRRLVDTPANRFLAQHAPPKALGAAVLQQIQFLASEAQQAQARVIARNRAQASGAGTYRGAVDTATAPAQRVFRRDPTRRDTEQLADLFAEEG